MIPDPRSMMEELDRWRSNPPPTRGLVGALEELGTDVRSGPLSFLSLLSLLIVGVAFLIREPENREYQRWRILSVS
jgi:hypothetical protein